ncbi:MAG: DNA integrity scanning protein DisA nucleotide-binding domain protein [Bacillus subtilis]|nr:DNA integrity scanning protein DisA nucleotide-binding domain protein [Bacillus subtilis]
MFVPLDLRSRHDLGERDSTPSSRNSASAQKNTPEERTEDEQRPREEARRTAVEFLANRKIGALITIERDVKLAGYINKAMAVNAPVTSELLASIFIPTTPLHDGAVIIRDDTILCAKAYYPSTERADLPLHYGTRHRAAIGISEQIRRAHDRRQRGDRLRCSVTINRHIDYDVSKETLQLYFEKYLKIR